MIPKQNGNELPFDATEKKAEEISEETPVTVGPAYQFGALEKVLSVYHPDQRMLREFQAIYSLLYHAAQPGIVKGRIRTGLLIRCEIEALALEMMNAVSEELCRQGLLRLKPEVLQEGCSIRRLPDPDALFCIFIGCESVPQITVSMSNSERNTAREQAASWKKFWEGVQQFAMANPQVIPVVILPRSVEYDSWRGQDWLYFRLFNRHITLHDLPAEDICDMTHQAIRKLGFTESDEFHAGLDRYIQVVYPKADLKARAFVDDLLERITNNHYSAIIPEGKLLPRCIPFYRQPKPVEDILSKLDSLIGMDEVRAAFEDIYYQGADAAGEGVRRRMHMAFVGNPGTGKTTVARLMADLLYQMGIIKQPKLTMKKPVDFLSPYVGLTAIQTREICTRALDGVLFIDEAYSLTRAVGTASVTGSAEAAAQQCIDTLIQEMENNSDRLVVILAGYPKPIEAFLNANEGLRSRVPRVIHFRDFTDEELLQIFLQNAEKAEMRIAEDAMDALKERISLERAAENFGNARSVENVFQAVMGIWSRSSTGEQVITAAHIRATMPEKRSSDIGSMESLDELKQQLRQFESRVRYLRTVSEKGLHVPPMNLHMLFVGNPGTGKTTVARAIAADLYQIGILKSNKCVTVTANDIVGNWNLATDNIKKYIAQAIGGILFIDEAYAMTEYASKGIGSEVITILLTAMEEHKSDLVVIFAGYEAEMRSFLAVNPGLASRIGSTFHFPDYTAEELTDMFVSKMQSFGYILAEEVPAQIHDRMEYFRVLPNFGNGRFVDTLMDQTITKRSLRGIDDICAFNEIIADDIPTIKEILEHRPDGQQLWDPAAVSQDSRRRTAIHEMGHAIVSICLRPEVTLSGISISAQAFSSGRISWEQSVDNLTEPQLMGFIATALAGRNAERLVLGCHSSGCSADYKMAKQLAASMLEDFAMGDSLGSSDISPILQKADEASAAVLSQHRELLIRLADRLLQQKSLTDAEVRSELSGAVR